MITLSHAPPNYVCPFCLVVEGIENEHVLTCQDDIIYRTDLVTAFVASHRFTRFSPNFLVIPNQHFENLYELPVSYGDELLEAKKIVALALKQVYNCDGISTRQHNEPCGSQDVWHYHEHVTPRFRNDKLYTSGTRLSMRAEERSEHAAKIRAVLKQF